MIGSRARGGMGAEETVPFSDRAAAEKFAAENGGRVVAFADVPREYVLGSAEASAAPVPHAQHGAADACAADAGPAGGRRRDAPARPLRSNPCLSSRAVA